MPWYCYRCPSCAEVSTLPVPVAAPRCPNPECDAAPDGVMRRDYRAEGVAVHTANLRKERESS